MRLAAAILVVMLMVPAPDLRSQPEEKIRELVTRELQPLQPRDGAGGTAIAVRIDGRFLGWDSDYGREQWTTDPSIDAIIGPYTAALNHYVRSELGYSSDLPYEVLTERVHPWSFKEFEARHIHVLDKLAEAMRVSPHLRVHVDCGYYDAATPYAAAEHDLAHLAIPAELAGNIQLAYYEAGHMMYLHEPSRMDQSGRLAAFVTANR